MMVLEQQKIIRLALARIVPNKNISTKPQFCQVHLNWSNLILKCHLRSTYQRSKNLERSTSNVDLHYIYIFGRYIKTNKLTLKTSAHNIICILLFSPFLWPVDCVPGSCLMSCLTLTPWSLFLPGQCLVYTACTMAWHTPGPSPTFLLPVITRAPASLHCDTHHIVHITEAHCSSNILPASMM